MIRGFVLGLSLLVGGLTGCSKKELTIDDAWIPAAPPHVPALAGYMTIDNGTERTQTLVGATSTVFERIEIHRTVYEKDSGLARMIPQEQVPIAPKESLLFEPGGYHLMLIHPKAPLQEGERISLNLIFADDSRFELEFQVRRRERLRP